MPPIYRINQMGVDAVEGLIETLLNDDDPDARYGSAIALGQIYAEQEIRTLNKARTVKGLIKALQDQEPAVRYWAAEALGRCGSKLAIEPLAGLLKDPHEGVRGQAQSSLHKIGGDQVQQLIEANRAKGFLGWLK
jgi:HEAT repeat protein